MNSYLDLVETLYDKGYCCLDIIKFIEQDKKIKKRFIFSLF